MTLALTTLPGVEARALAAFRAHHPSTPIAWQIGPLGNRYWLTRYQMRIQAIVHRETGRQIRLRDIASEAGVSLSTVHRTIRRLVALGVLEVSATRGRLGRTIVRWLRRGNVPPVGIPRERGSTSLAYTGGTFTAREPRASARFSRWRAWEGMRELVDEVFGS